MIGAKLRENGIDFPLMGQAELSFWQLPAKERMVLIAAYFCDQVGVKEESRNRGKWIDRFITWVKLNPLGRFAWCAAAVSAWSDLAEANYGPKTGRAAVRNWAKWAKEDNRLGFRPQRGDLFYWLNADGTGHMGIITDATPEFIDSIEANTSSGKKGSQRDGDGLYRRTRLIKDGMKFIRL